MKSFSQALAEHVRSPRNVGKLSGEPAHGVGHGVGRNAACGDELHLWIRADGAAVGEARFQAQSCSAVIACASLATDALRGVSLDAARAFDVSELVARAGGLPRERMHACSVVHRALEDALKEIESAGGPRALGQGS